MWNKRRRLTAVIGAGLALAVLVLVLAPLFVGGDRFKPQLEAAASKALGMEVRISGRVAIAIFPRPRVTLHDGSILGAEGDTVASAKETALGLAMLPLLRRELRLVDVGLSAPDIRVERAEDGHSNLDSLARAILRLGILEGASITITDGSVRYVDHGGRGATKAGTHVFATQVRAKMTAKARYFVIDPMTARLYGGTLRGSLSADLAGKTPHTELDLTLSSFRIEQFLAAFSSEPGAEGAMDFTAKLTTHGTSLGSSLPSLSGDVSLRGRNLVLRGNDLDRALSRYKSSQTFHLVDVGAMFLAGPMGLAVSRGYSFSGLLRGADGTTPIPVLVSDWKVENGIAHARDVALSTLNNRIALQGDLDFVHERFEDVTVAAVDAQGRVKVQQTIRGPFAKPEVDRPNFLESAAGPVLGLFRNTRRVLPGGERVVFYAGSVSPPKQ